jgi:hypothetical protein
VPVPIPELCPDPEPTQSPDTIFNDFDNLQIVEEIEDVLPVNEEEDIPEIDPAEIEEVEEVEEVEELEEGTQKLEEVGEAVAPRNTKYGWSKVLRLKEVHVKVRDGRTWACTLRDATRGRRTGQAIEIKGRVKRQTVYGVVIVEGSDCAKVGSALQIDPDDDNLAILGCDDRRVGWYTPVPWAERSTKPIWIFDDFDRKTLKIVPEPGKGRCSIQLPNGTEVGEVLTEAAHEGQRKVGWFSREEDCYLRFGAELDDRPLDKLLCLATILGMDLLFETVEEPD